MRLIDADALIDKYGDWYTEEGMEEGYIGTIKGIVDSMPTIEERKTGEWIVEDDGYTECCRCDQCGKRYVDISNFCPNCGADMRGGNHE